MTGPLANVCVLSALIRVANTFATWRMYWQRADFAKFLWPVFVLFLVAKCWSCEYVTFFYLSFFTRWHVPPTRTCAEACLTGWRNRRPQEWDKCCVARHHQACLTVCVKGVLQRTFFISTNERLMYKFYKNSNYFIFK